MSDTQPNILIVDDDSEVRESISEYLMHNGFSVAVASDGTSMRERLSQREPLLIVLDLNLPGESGLDIARWLRSRGSVAIIMLTGLDDPVDRVVGLEIGADDYIGKPVHPRELLARIRSILRRTEGSAARVSGPIFEADDRVRFGTKWLLPNSRVLQDDSGKIHPLTTSEFNLLKAFADHPRRVLSRDRLLDLANARDPDAFDRAIDVRVTRLRKKIEVKPDDPEYIQTVRGAGYVFSPDGQRFS